MAERLGFRPSDRPDSWAEAVFHLGWHFPHPGIPVTRTRLWSCGQGPLLDMPCREMDLRLGWFAPSADVFPGVVVSHLGEGIDFLSASEVVLGLIREALDGIGRAERPRPHQAFNELRGRFAQAGMSFGGVAENVTARLFRLANGFHSPPATEWATFPPVDDGLGEPQYFVLSHLYSERVVCELRGGALEDFVALADRAGSLLPTWPASQYPDLLGDMPEFARRWERRLTDPALSIGVPDSSGLVTDHRGHAERWIGFVFGQLFAHRGEHLHLYTHPAEAAGRSAGDPVSAVVTLVRVNMFTASAHAIELGDRG